MEALYLCPSLKKIFSLNSILSVLSKDRTIHHAAFNAIPFPQLCNYQCYFTQAPPSNRLLHTLFSVSTKWIMHIQLVQLDSWTSIGWHWLCTQTGCLHKIHLNPVESLAKHLMWPVRAFVSLTPSGFIWSNPFITKFNYQHELCCAFSDL